MKWLRDEQGFTLIEVIVVIIMIGVLAAIAIPIYSGYIFRARASEGITTLGAIKTFMLERRVSTGIWPDKTELLEEFNNLNDLYYFSNDPADITIVENGDKISVTIKAADPEFGLPDDYGIGIMTIHIAFQGEKGDSGWSGNIVTDYARHLPRFAPPSTP